MLENRDYMRGEPDGGTIRLHASASAVLMFVLVVVYALQRINDVYLHTNAEYWLALTRDGVRSGYLWQLLTFQFLHGSLWHLFGNLLGLWFIGRFVEHVLGLKRFLAVYFLAGAAGGLLQGVLMLAFPMHYGMAVYGASAGVSGAFAVFAMLQGQTEVRWNFILPIPAKTLLIIYAGIAAFFTLVPSPRDGTAHAAHLGGILVGIAWVKLGWHHDFVPLPWENLLARLQFWRPSQSRQRKQELVRAASVRGRLWRTNSAPDEPETGPEEFISKEVDPILDKISAHGLQSLTERERKILDAARKKMSKP
jgi:membrane associated rhomboid family serine protease